MAKIIKFCRYMNMIGDVDCPLIRPTTHHFTTSLVSQLINMVHIKVDFTSHNLYTFLREIGLFYFSFSLDRGVCVGSPLKGIEFSKETGIQCLKRVIGIGNVQCAIP